MKKLLSPLILFFETLGVGLTVYELYQIYHPDGWSGLIAFASFLYIIGFTLVFSLVGVTLGKLNSNKFLFVVSVVLTILYIPLAIYSYINL